MPQTIEERLLARRAAEGRKTGKISKPSKILGDVAEGYKALDTPLWEAPARWGAQLGNTIDQGLQTDTSVFDSPWKRAAKWGVHQAANQARSVGSVVSGLTSPVSIATAIGSLGAAVPEMVGANVARGGAMLARGAGGLQAAQGLAQAGKGAYEGDPTEFFTGAAQTGLGAMGARAPMPEKSALPFKATPKATPHSAGFGATAQSISPGMAIGGKVSGRLPPSVSAASSAMREVPPTTTYPTPSPRTLLGGQESVLPTPYQRALTEGTGGGGFVTPPAGPRFTASQFGVADRGVGPVGVVERGAVQGGPPQGLGPVSAGMNRPGPGQAAFEAMVPERYKGNPIPPVDPTGLNMNLRGEAPPTPTPGLRTIGPTGKLQAPKGTISLEQMVAKYGIEEAAARAQMTPQELAETLAAKKVGAGKTAPKKAPAPPKPAAKVEPKVEPKAAAPKAPPAEKIAPPAKGEVRMFEKSPIDTLNALAQRGNKHAIRELELRGVAPQGVAKKPVGKGPLARLKSETGAVGKDIEQAQIGGPGDVPTRPSSGASGWDEPSAVAERESKWQQTMSEMGDRRMRDGFENAVKRDPDLYGRTIDDVMKKNPDFTPDQAHEHVFNRYKERIAEDARLGEEKLNVDQWGKVNPEWERPPFRPVEDIPDAAEALDQRYTTESGHSYEQDRMVPSKNWYAGQKGIDRAQVERVKKFGINDPADAASQSPYVRIDENGNYQVLEGHHRMTAALEEGKPVDLTVEDFQPTDSWMRKTRGMKGEQSPFAVKGKQAASAFQQEMEGGAKPESRFAKMISDETGAVGRDISEAQARNAARRAAGRGVVSNTTAGKAMDVAEEVARTGMLGGLAPLKSGLGGIGAHVLGALETKSTGPLKSLMDLPAHGRNFMEGWRGGHSPEGYGPMSNINFIGRGMGAGDYAMEQSLIKGGVDPTRAKELMLNAPNALSTDPKLNTRLGRFLVPFKTIPYNAFAEGMSRYEKHPRIFGGAALAGAGLGAMTSNPESVSMGAAAAGPYSVPFLAGAGATAGVRALQGISPLPEWAITKGLTDPLARYTKPAISRWIPGMGEETEQEKARAKRTKGREESRAKREKERESRKR